MVDWLKKIGSGIVALVSGGRPAIASAESTLVSSSPFAIVEGAFPVGAAKPVGDKLPPKRGEVQVTRVAVDNRFAPAKAFFPEMALVEPHNDNMMPVEQRLPDPRPFADPVYPPRTKVEPQTLPELPVEQRLADPRPFADPVYPPRTKVEPRPLPELPVVPANIQKDPRPFAGLGEKAPEGVVSSAIPADSFAIIPHREQPPLPNEPMLPKEHAVVPKSVRPRRVPKATHTPDVIELPGASAAVEHAQIASALDSVAHAVEKEAVTSHKPIVIASVALVAIGAMFGVLGRNKNKAVAQQSDTNTISR